MPLQLLLLRHAEAEEKKSGMVDFDRELTPKGVNQCLSLGEQLKKILSILIISLVAHLPEQN
jgi:phosphohistidine phosphatase SixA